MNPFLLTDAYKIGHPNQYPDKTQYVYSNTTGRKSRIEGVSEIVVFGIQYLIDEYLVKQFNENFFNRPKQEVVSELKEFFDEYFGQDSVDVTRYGDLHDLGYLPIVIKALPEGSRCPIGVPFMTIINTDPKFYWITNFIETLTQTVIWNPITCATIADSYRKLLDEYAEETSSVPEFVWYQGHNFSMRGMSSVESGLTADAGHLLSFKGSDTLPGNLFVKKYYGADPKVDQISCSVNATEHAVMCAGGDENERETFRRLICDIYPSGIVSIVSDTWNLWDVLTVIAPSLKGEIENREGKVVFRPDSGDPVKIVCGYFVKENSYLPHGPDEWEFFWEKGYDAVKTPEGIYFDKHGRELSESEVKGCIQLLDEHFGSTVNEKGYRELNPKVGLIYGDSITTTRARQICEQLKRKGYASTNVVLGIGSYSYQYNTRDTFSIACKATWVVVDGVARDIFKDPITDDGTKKSAKGLMVVEEVGGHIAMRDCVSREEEEEGMLVVVFRNGRRLRRQNFHNIRNRLAETRAVSSSKLVAGNI